MKKKFWQFKDLSDGNAELLLYGEIMSEHSWFDDGDDNVYVKEFVQDLQNLGNVPQITVRVNSAGGDVFAAIAIYTQLKTNTARIVAVVDGLAASAATLPLMAADEIQIPDGAIIMIHDPTAVMMGMYNSADLAKQKETLDSIKQSIIAIYSARTGLDEDTISNMMTGETWMQADEAINNGFADTKIDEKVSSKIDMKGRKLYMNDVTHDLSGYQTMPELKHAAKIQKVIANANSGGNFLTRFVALSKSAAKKEKKTNEDQPDDNNSSNSDPDTNDPNKDNPDADDPDDDDKSQNAAAGKKKPSTKNRLNSVWKDEAAGEVDSQVHAQNVAAFKNLFPNFYSHLVDDTKAEERKRIQDIDALSCQVDPKLVNKAKYENPISAMELSYESMRNSTAKGAAYLSARAQAAKNSGVENITSVPGQSMDYSPEQKQVEYGNLIAGYANKKMNPNFQGKEANQ